MVQGCEIVLSGLWPGWQCCTSDCAPRDARLCSKLALSRTPYGRTARQNGKESSHTVEHTYHLPSLPSSLHMHKVYVLDMRNHGDSPHVSEMTFDLMARDTVRFLEERDIEKTVLLGHSLGGSSAMYTTLK